MMWWSVSSLWWRRIISELNLELGRVWGYEYLFSFIIMCQRGGWTRDKREYLQTPQKGECVLLVIEGYPVDEGYWLFE